MGVIYGGVQVVEELVTEANGHCAELKVIEIPSNV
jgi:hypothetical protein